MPKHLISEQTIIEASKSGQKTIVVAEGTIITAAARDKAASLGIKFVSKSTSDGTKGEPIHIPSEGVLQRSPPKVRKDSFGESIRTFGLSDKHKGEETIAIGSDHGGFQLKQTLIPFLESLGYKVVDVGTYNEEPCDYPDFAYMVSRMVSLGEASKGIMIDAVGVASAMVANKIPGIRATCCLTEFAAKSSREHNDANVLTLGGRVLGTEAAKSIVKAWLETWFGGGRHKGRVDKITEIEKRYLKS